MLSVTPRFAGQKALFPKPREKWRIRQGGIPNCQTLAVVDALLNNPTGNRILHQSVQEKDGVYTVRFRTHPDQTLFFTPKEFILNPLAERIRIIARRRRLKLTDAQVQRYISLLQVAPNGRFELTIKDKRKLGRVLTKMPQKGRSLATQVQSSHRGVQILERAYAQLQRLLFPHLYPVRKVPAEDPLAVFCARRTFHYLGTRVLKSFTGWESSYLYSGWSQKSFGAVNMEKRILNLLEKLAKNPADYIVTVSSVCCKGDKKGAVLDEKKRLHPWHLYSVRKIDLKQQKIHLANPHDTLRLITLSFDELMRYFRKISYAKVKRRPNR